jgi:hypothetical protein
MRRSRKPAVQSITGARPGTSVDVDRRMHRYLFSMGIRTVCFVGAVVASGPLRWVLLICALVLPYIAVVIANGGRPPARDAGPAPVRPVADPALGPAASPSEDRR